MMRKLCLKMAKLKIGTYKSMRKIVMRSIRGLLGQRDS